MSVLAHELAEVATDPLLPPPKHATAAADATGSGGSDDSGDGSVAVGGWFGPGLNEIADPCERDFGALAVDFGDSDARLDGRMFNQRVGGRLYMLQQLWDQRAGRCASGEWYTVDGEGSVPLTLTAPASNGFRLGEGRLASGAWALVGAAAVLVLVGPW